MHLKVSQKLFIFLAFLLFTVLHAVAMAFFLDFLIIIKSLIYKKLVIYVLSVGCLGLAHSKNINFIWKECPNFEGVDGSIGT